MANTNRQHDTGNEKTDYVTGHFPQHNIVNEVGIDGAGITAIQSPLSG